jgi:hypothetical protein
VRVKIELALVLTLKNRFMKHQIVLFTAFAGMLYLSLSSKQNGAGSTGYGDQTGRVAGQSCSQVTCHANADSGGITYLEFREKSTGLNGPTVSEFKAGTTYIATLKCNIPGSPLPKFGFQLTAVNSAGLPAGSFSNFPANVQKWEAYSSGVMTNYILEHTSALPKDVNGKYTVNVDWTAGQDNLVRFFGAVVAVNDDGTVAGDVAENGYKVMSTVVSVNRMENKIAARVYPNPVSDRLHISISQPVIRDCKLIVYNVQGKKISEQPIQQDEVINTSAWVSGTYLVHLTGSDGTQKITTVIKH